MPKLRLINFKLFIITIPSAILITFLSQYVPARAHVVLDSGISSYICEGTGRGLCPIDTIKTKHIGYPVAYKTWVIRQSDNAYRSDIKNEIITNKSFSLMRFVESTFLWTMFLLVIIVAADIFIKKSK